MALVGQRRCFMTPPIGAGVTQVFSDHFRGRGQRRKEQFVPSNAPNNKFAGVSTNRDVTAFGRPARAIKRMPDIDDPRPPIVGWQGELEPDGSLPIMPFQNASTNGRKIMQGLYKKFRELYNQHYTFYPMYGGGAWDPRKTISFSALINRSATVAGDTVINNHVFIYPGTVIRGDLNRATIGPHTIIMEGCTVTTDGHPRNVHLPGRVSRINEGECKIGSWSIIHPNCVIDSVLMGDFCEVGEGCKMGYNSVMEFGSSLEPGTVLLAHQRVPRFEVWAGNPARKVGSRDKNVQKWMEYIEQVQRVQALTLMAEQPYRSNQVAATRSSEKLEAAYDRLVMQKQGHLPEEAKEFIASETREVPLWEEFKNVTRVNTRPGVRRGHDWTVDPNRARWVNYY
eukprot:TRINITY_DN21115_c0_g1_i1.p1 TRINITY_DN21115_c0_g1~~TRINITY_DN21115_c0_g1_i1.p1  ORF type:complete len:408 (+),score=83.22 TRINITY_DN21115_c0_g1_i1:35-1225(+)